MASLECFE